MYNSDAAILSPYKDQISETRLKINQLKQRVNHLSLWRLACMLLTGLAIFQALQLRNSILLVLVSLLGLVIFLWLVKKHQKLESALDWEKDFLEVCENEVSVLTSGQNKYSNGAMYSDGKHPYSADLDIFGPFSIYNKLNRCATVDANRHLASWLEKPAPIKEINLRQAAIAEMSEASAWTQELQTALWFCLKVQSDMPKFLKNYFQHKTSNFNSNLLKLYVSLAPFLWLSLFIMGFWVPYCHSLLTGLSLLHIIWSLAKTKAVSVYAAQVNKVGKQLKRYASVLSHLEKKSWKSNKLNNLHAQLQQHEGQPSISGILHQLGSLIDKLDTRNNLLANLVLNTIFLWDFKQVMALEEWKAKHEHALYQSFEVLAQYECLMSFASCRRNYPHWSFPELQEAATSRALHIKAIGHPLIAESQVVLSDFDSEHHQIALITGSNMAGKSTFLRAIGCNLVLAYAGGVVCAQSMQVPLLKLISYMRIKDDLQESTSTFKAELDRMRYILSFVKLHGDSYFLIDEMLRGTNSIDKYRGSLAIIKKLLAENAYGLIATHDLQLSALSESYPLKVENFHFDIQMEGDEMHFDYKLKHGACSIFNAPMLLKSIGIELEP